MSAAEESMIETTTATDASLSLDTDMSLEGMIALVMSDGKRYEISRRALRMSRVLMTSLSSESDCSELPINQNSEWMGEVIRFLEYHSDKDLPPEIQKPLRHKEMSEVTTAWCAEYIDELAKKRDRLWEVMKIANYLDIPSLLHLCCAKTAGLIKGQKLEDIKKILLTDEE